MGRIGGGLVPAMWLAIPLILTGAASGPHTDPWSVPDPAAQDAKAIGPSGEKMPLTGAMLAAAITSSPAVSAEAGPLQVSATLPPPAGFVQASNCVANEGIHYIREKEKALTPILSYDETGKLVSLEYIIAQKALQAGASWKGLPGVAGRSIDHIDVDFYPSSRRANSTPYYSVHLYFIDAKEQQQICPKSTSVEPVGRAIRSQ